jgi:hypothetical protein
MVDGHVHRPADGQFDAHARPAPAGEQVNDQPLKQPRRCRPARPPLAAPSTFDRCGSAHGFFPVEPAVLSLFF